jgi:ankyrin repeat protein
MTAKNSFNISGKTPEELGQELLDELSYEGCPLETVKALIRAGASLHERNDINYTALMLAAEDSFTSCVEALIKAGANVNDQDDDGSTVLICAVDSACDEECVAALLRGGADFNRKNEDGMTALMFAAERGAVATAKLLIDAGANLDEKNNDGMTALMIAATAVENNARIEELSKGRREVARLLKDGLAGKARAEAAAKEKARSDAVAAKRRGLNKRARRIEPKAGK